MRLLLVRHGETDWNASERIQGWTDIPLNAAGRRQARLLAERLREEAVAAVYSSDLARALETARYLALERPGGAVPLRVTETLREIRYGEWEGKTRQELVQAGCGPWLEAWVRGHPCPAPRGGETREEVDRRVERFLSAIFPRHEQETVIVVSHGGPLRLLLARLAGRPVSGWGGVRQANAALSEVIVEPGRPPVLVRVNDTTHYNPPRPHIR
ncbi:MAG: histidine phosphatase family protein [Bacillota bacterium]|jgi:Fructose-2,6-bisphosphatase